MPAAVNSANEEVNALFRQGKVRFNDIPDLILEGASKAKTASAFTVDDIDDTDKTVREAVLSAVSRKD